MSWSLKASSPPSWLPAARFANFQEASRRVHTDGHIEVAKAYYSAPPEYVGHTVWARWDGRLVRIFNARGAALTVHAQKLPGEFSTHRQHIVSEKINAVERGAELLVEADVTLALVERARCRPARIPEELKRLLEHAP